MLSIPQDKHAAAKIYQSLLVFSRIAETRPMFEWFKNELARMDMISRHERDRDLAGELRGARQVIEFLLDEIAASPEKASKISDIIHKTQNKGAVR